MTDAAAPILIGVDGGGSGCRVVIADAQETVLGEATGGAANATTDFDGTVRNVIAAIEAAAALAGIDPATLSKACVYLGLAGVISDEIANRVAGAMPFANCVVKDDRPAAVVGGLGDADGFMLSVGTGRIVASSRAGILRFVGGWGFNLSDQGSAAWVGRKVLEDVLLAHDGILPATPLTDEVFAGFKHDPNAIVAFSMMAKPVDYGIFAPKVVAAATVGDPGANHIMREGARHLQHALQALDFQHGDRLCLTGGLGAQYAPYLAPAFTQLITAPVGTSLQGALRLAADDALRIKRAEAATP